MGEQDKYEREVREIQRGEMQVKESAQIYRGKTKRRDAEWGGQKRECEHDGERQSQRGCHL